MTKIKDAATEFLSHRRVAVTGVSRSPKDHGANFVYKRLRDRGYEVFAVNPNADEVEGDRCYHDLGSIPGGVEAVVIGTRPELAEQTVRECGELGIERVWMHRGPGAGSVSEAAADTAGSTASPSSTAAARACSARRPTWGTGRCESSSRSAGTSRRRSRQARRRWGASPGRAAVARQPSCTRERRARSFACPAHGGRGARRRLHVRQHPRAVRARRGRASVPGEAGHIAVLVGATIVVFWLAHVYADGLGHSVAHDRRLTVGEYATSLVAKLDRGSRGAAGGGSAPGRLRCALHGDGGLGGIRLRDRRPRRAGAQVRARRTAGHLRDLRRRRGQRLLGVLLIGLKLFVAH